MQRPEQQIMCWLQLMRCFIVFYYQNTSQHVTGTVDMPGVPAANTPGGLSTGAPHHHDQHHQHHTTPATHGASGFEQRECKSGCCQGSLLFQHGVLCTAQFELSPTLKPAECLPSTHPLFTRTCLHHRCLHPLCFVAAPPHRCNSSTRGWPRGRCTRRRRCHGPHPRCVCVCTVAASCVLAGLTTPLLGVETTASTFALCGLTGLLKPPTHHLSLTLPLCSWTPAVSLCPCTGTQQHRMHHGVAPHQTARDPDAALAAGHQEGGGIGHKVKAMLPGERREGI